MPTFKTTGVLSVSTGRLLGDIDDVYKVISFLCGRDVFTHELAYYGDAASQALRSAIPDLPGNEEAKCVSRENYKEWLLQWQDRFGATIEIPDSLRSVLADNKSALTTLSEMK